MINFAPPNTKKPMLLKEIKLRHNEPFEQAIEAWANQNNITATYIDKSEELYDSAEALIIFHEEHNISKDVESIEELFEKNNKFTRSIDINGTMTASLSAIIFWLENNKPQDVLMIGDEKLLKNERFEQFLNQLSGRLK